MAIFNEILVGRFNRGLQKLFGIKGSPPVRQLAGEISAAHPLFSGAENRYLEGWSRYAVAFTRGAAGAANTNKNRIRNPVGSNVIAVVEKIFFSNGNIDNPFVNYEAVQTADFAATPTRAGLDSRHNPLPNCIVSFESNAVGLTGIAIWQAQLPASYQADVILTEDQQLPLLPGAALSFSQTVVNLPFQVFVWWRERPLEESERQ
jgi:hypothetical protein